MLIIPHTKYNLKDRPAKWSEVVVEGLAHSPGQDKREMVIYYHSDSDPENALRYYIPYWDFANHYQEV